MSNDSTLRRHEDGKLFHVVYCMAHWAGIKSEDGEEDSVKWLGFGSQGQDEYISNSKGYGYELLAPEKRNGR